MLHSKPENVSCETSSEMRNETLHLTLTMVLGPFLTFRTAQKTDLSHSHHIKIFLKIQFREKTHLQNT